MSSNPSWKKSNQNKTFNNVKMDILNYQDGKWKDVNTVQTIGTTERTINKVVQKHPNTEGHKVFAKELYRFYNERT